MSTVINGGHINYHNTNKLKLELLLVFLIVLFLIYISDYLKLFNNQRINQ